MTDFFIKMFTARSGLSTKRVCGFIGWIVCLLIAIYCTIMSLQAPLIIDTILFCVVGLLGVDSITSIWKKGTH